MGLECEWRHAQKRWAENLRILKKGQLKVDIGPCRQTIESLPLGHKELSSLPLRHVVGVFQISTFWDLKHFHSKQHSKKYQVRKRLAMMAYIDSCFKKSLPSTIDTLPIIHICREGIDILERVTKGKTSLIQKAPKKKDNSRPITCLPMMHNILTAQIREDIRL